MRAVTAANKTLIGGEYSWNSRNGNGQPNDEILASFFRLIEQSPRCWRRYVLEHVRTQRPELQCEFVLTNITLVGRLMPL